MYVENHGDYTIEEKLLDYVVPNRVLHIRYDLDRSAVSSKRASLWRVSNSFRARLAWVTTIRVTVALSITGGFQKLRQWTQSGPNYLPNFGNENLSRDAQLELRVPRTDCDETRNFMIDAAELVSATTDLYSSTVLRTVMYVAEEETQGDDHELLEFRAGLLLFVHNLIKKSLKSRCPKMWMRGDLRAAFAGLNMVTVMSNACSTETPLALGTEHSIICSLQTSFDTIATPKASRHMPTLISQSARTLYLESQRHWQGL